jgi:hypothetical protein
MTTVAIVLGMLFDLCIFGVCWLSYRDHMRYEREFKRRHNL